MNSYLTTSDLMKLWRVSDEALRKFRQNPRDPLPHLKAGRRILYLHAEVEEWARRQASSAERVEAERC